MSIHSAINSSLEEYNRGQDPRQPEVFFRGSKEVLSEEDLLLRLGKDRKEVEEIEAVIEVLKIYLSVPDKIQNPDDLRKLIETKNSFLNLVEYPEDREIFRVSLTERPKGKTLLDNLDAEYINKITNFKSADEAAEFLQERLALGGMAAVTELRKNELSSEDRKILRIDFNGFTKYPDEDKLSPEYKNYEAPHAMPNPNDYDFAGTFWEKMGKSPRMAGKENMVRETLAHNMIDQDLLSKMSVFDFEDAYYKYADDKGFAKIETAGFCEGAKAQTVRQFINNHEKEFRDNLIELGCPKEEIARAANIMKSKGMIPVIHINDKMVMTASVHHNIAIQDSGQFDNMFESNDSKNHVIMFEIKEKKAASSRKITSKQLKSSSIALNHEEIDLKELTYNPEAKKEFIKALAKENFENLFYSMRKLGLDAQEASDIIVQMNEKGTIDPIMVDDVCLGVSVRKINGKFRLDFGVQETDNQDVNVHTNVSHGLDSHPQARVDNPEKMPTVLMPKDDQYSSSYKHVDEKDAFTEELKDKTDIERKHWITRIRTMASSGVDNAKKPIAYIGGLSKVIYRNEADDKEPAPQNNKKIHIQGTQHGSFDRNN